MRRSDTGQIVEKAALFLALAGVAGAERPLAPDFRVYDATGATRRLSDYRGKVVALNFWATWCRPCRTEVQWFNEIHREYESQGFTVLGVAMDERGWAAVKPFLAEHGIEYPVLLGNARVARLYGGLKTLPQTLFLDRQGRIVASHSAIIGQSQLRRIVTLLLADPDQPQ